MEIQAWVGNSLEQGLVQRSMGRASGKVAEMVRGDCNAIGVPAVASGSGCIRIQVDLYVQNHGFEVHGMTVGHLEMDGRSVDCG